MSKIERYRQSMAGDVLHSWAADAQKELDQLRAEVEALTTTLGTPDEIVAEPAADHEALRKQFMSLLMLANSKCRQTRYWHSLWNRLSDQAMVNDADAERDTNAMLTDALVKAEAERDELRAAVAQYAPLHEAIQRAAGELPDGWEIRVCVERHGGGVELIGPAGTEDFDTNNERLDYTVIDALEAAMAAKEGV